MNRTREPGDRGTVSPRRLRVAVGALGPANPPWSVLAWSWGPPRLWWPVAAVVVTSAAVVVTPAVVLTSPPVVVEVATASGSSVPPLNIATMQPRPHWLPKISPCGVR